MGVDMTVLIVVESWFGNTRTVAQNIAAGVSDAGGHAQITDVQQAEPELPADAGLVVIGGPTHNRGMSTAATRARAAESALGAPAGASGIREWIGQVQLLEGVGFAVFDTATSTSWFSGSAAKAATRELVRRGARVVGEPHSFLVAGLSGPLRDGQEDRARQWGRRIAAASLL